MALWVSWEGVKRDWFPKIYFLKKIRYDTTGFDAGFSQKKVNLLEICHI